jgi:hypothetical protein
VPRCRLLQELSAPSFNPAHVYIPAGVGSLCAMAIIVLVKTCLNKRKEAAAKQAELPLAVAPPVAGVQK